MAEQNIAYAGKGEIIAGPINHLWVVVEREGSRWFAQVYERNTKIQERASTNQVDANQMAFRMRDLLSKYDWKIPGR